MELLPAVETLQWLAEHGPRILDGERIGFSRTQHPVKRGRWTYEPLGVVGVLGPAAEPFATPLGDVAVALMAGNGVVLKPSPHVPLCGRADRPRLRARRPARGPAARRPRPRRRGRRARRGARRPGPLHRHDARRPRGRRGLRAWPQAQRPRARRQGRDARARRRQRRARGARRRVGRVRQRRPVRRQRRSARSACTRCSTASSTRRRRRRASAPGRRSARPRDVDRPARLARARCERVAELVDDAVAAGATLHCGGPSPAHGAFFAPAVLTGVGADARLPREEVPGPVLVVEAVESEEDAIARANASPSASAPRSGPPTATRARGSPASCRSGWCG